VIKTIWSVTFHVSDLRKTADFYEKTPRLTKKYEHSSNAVSECRGTKIVLIPKEKVKISKNVPTVEFIGILLSLSMTNNGTTNKQASSILMETFRKSFKPIGKNISI